MKICFITEGSYPYIVGGVSSWVDSFLKWFPDFEFSIISISPKEENQGIYAYRLTGNLTELSEIFLDSALKKVAGNSRRKFLKNEEEKRVIERHFSGEFSQWPEIFDIVRRMGKDKTAEFFSSKEFLDIGKKIYMKKYTHVPFVEFLWLLRSMYLYQFFILNAEIPSADIYHSVCCGYGGLVGALASYLNNKPFVITEHGIYTREREEEIIKSSEIKEYARDIWVKYFYNMSLGAYQFARTVVSLYERNRQMQIDLGCSESKTIVLPNGIDISYFKETVENKEMKHDEILLGAIVRVVPIKDIISMLKGYSMAKNQNQRLKLMVMGPLDEDEDYYQYCMEYIEKNNIQDVVFTGKVDIRKYLKQIDMLLLTSISEAQPLSVLEGMTCKVPVIVTDVGSCRELVYGLHDDYGVAGIVIPIMDSAKLAQSILYLEENPDIRKKMGEAGAKRVRSLYTKEIFIENYKVIYAILKGGQNGGNWFPIEKAD